MPKIAKKLEIQSLYNFRGEGAGRQPADWAAHKKKIQLSMLLIAEKP